MVSASFKRAQGNVEDELDERRKRLADKLFKEEAQLQHELRSAQITAEERRSKLEKRARDLMAQREAERENFAEEMLYRQWRENCDGVRAGDSKAITLHYADERMKQVAQKQAVLLANDAEHRAFDAMMERERLKLENRFQQDLKRRKERDDEAVRVLNEQVADLHIRRELAAEVQKKEVEELKARWKEQDAAAEAEQQAIYARNKRLGEELVAFNKQKQAEVRAADERERAFDSAMVEEAIRQAREEEDRENELKDQKKEQDRMYRSHLAILMQKEAVSEAERESLIASEQAKSEAKRQAEQDKADLARAKLMEEVVADRRRQAAERLQAMQVSHAEKQAERERLQQEMDIVAKIEQDYQLKLRAERLQHRLDVEAQMRAKEAAKIKQKEEARLEFLGAREAEQQYLENIQKDAQKPKEVQPYFGRKTTKWYS
mmetsp:Transcript_6490/g.22834  ORF Transcript_6490/g.22834 Transcript_6490/m.22834 type:complete len:434 (+) Transcript_6490:456-1757(+)